ncbi:hypothetical protein AKO1_009551 [Acrasis kona]|uniref:Sphingomyelin phosphodiesterase n=1 Tax=Acrasis kona TaxID=1008807 RepID=A0AAW2ZNU6_9EUKA
MSRTSGNARDCDYLCKIIIVGDKGAGKSCLVQRHVNEEFQALGPLPIIGVDFKIKTLVLEEKVIEIQLWDTEYPHAGRLWVGFYRGAKGALVVYDVTNEKSFQNVTTWLKNIENYVDTDDIKLILVGTKIDDVHRRVVSRKDGELLAKQLDISFIETSAKNNINVDEVFNNIIHSAVNTGIINKKLQTQIIPPISKEKDSTCSSYSCSIILLSNSTSKHKLYPCNMTSTDVFKVVTFNILAPCYFRSLKSITSGVNFHDAKTHELESGNPEMYRKRFDLMINMIKTDEKPTDHNNLFSADVFCLQEFWFTDEIVHIFENGLMKGNNAYDHSFYMRRPFPKKDGLACFVRSSEKLKVISHKGIDFRDVGERVAQLLHIQIKDGEQNIIIVNTHLTFPHTKFDENILRMQQIKSITNAVDEYIKETKIDPIVMVTGDLNTSTHTKKDLTLEHLEKEGYTSSYKKLHGNHSFISHFNHNNETVGADYIFYRNGLHSSTNVSDVYVYPKQITDKEWVGEEKVSTHWMSDHRPLVASFDIAQ